MPTALRRLLPAERTRLSIWNEAGLLPAALAGGTECNDIDPGPKGAATSGREALQSGMRAAGSALPGIARSGGWALQSSRTVAAAHDPHARGPAAGMSVLK
jgi:hypothetical protein